MIDLICGKYVHVSLGSGNREKEKGREVNRMLKSGGRNTEHMLKREHQWFTLWSRAISSCWVRITSSLSASCWRMWRCSRRRRASNTSKALSTRPSCSFRSSLPARTSASFSCSLVVNAATSCRQRTVCRRSAVRVSSSSRRSALTSHSIWE